MPDFSDLTFAQNPDPRCPVVLMLDCSDSMDEPLAEEPRTPLEALSGGLDVLVSELSKDPLARRRVEVSIVAYGSDVRAATTFVTVDDLVLPTLEKSGLTSTGAALNVALDLLEERKQTYRRNGVSYYRPWIMLITDGLATDDTTNLPTRIKEAEEAKKLAFFSVGVEGADMDALSELSVRAPLPLDGIKFAELFVWLSASQARVSASQIGDAVPLPSPDGWAEV